MIDVYLSRSKIERMNLCPRAGYWNYVHAGRGISKSPGPVYFDTGSGVHAGLATALRFIQAGNPISTWEMITKCVLDGLKDFDRRSTVSLPNEDFNEKYLQMELRYREEQRDMVAALIYAWCVEEWAGFANRYEILMVEQDSEFVEKLKREKLNHFALMPAVDYEIVNIHWESKADAIVREKLPPHSTAVISWKTAADVSDWTRKQYRSDLQGQLECYFGQLAAGIPIDYNQVIYLVKGKKLRLDAAGAPLSRAAPFELVNGFKTDSHLLYPLIKPDDLPSRFFNEIEGIEPDTAWAGRYYPPGEERYKQINGWDSIERFTLSEVGPVSGAEIPKPYLFHWIDKLSQGKIFPTPDYCQGETALSRTIVWEQPTMRNENLTKHLLRQISDRQVYLHTSEQPEVDYFQNLRACYDSSPGGCEFFGICIENHGSAPLIQLDGWQGIEPPAGFEWRRPHHNADAKRFETKSIDVIDDNLIPF